MTAPAVPTDLREPAAARRAAFRLAVALVGLTVVVIVMGAMVTSTGSGLAFRDWPFSDGQLMPARSYTTLAGFFEHFHRVAVGLDAVLTLALAVVVLRAPGTGRAARCTVVLGLGLLVVQAVVGGVGVLLKLPYVTSVTHGTLAQLTIANFAIGAYLLSDRWQRTAPAPHPAAGAARKLTVAGVAALVVQTVIGAIARHSNAESALVTHVGNAFVVFLLLLIGSGHATGRFGRVPGVAGLARLLLWLLVLQIALGFVALLVRTGKHPENIEHLWRAALISAHVLTGAMLTLVASLLAAHVFRGTIVARARPERA